MIIYPFNSNISAPNVVDDLDYILRISDLKIKLTYRDEAQKNSEQVVRPVRHPQNLSYNPFARHILWNLQDIIKNANVNRPSINKLSQTGKNGGRPKAERIKALA